MTKICENGLVHLRSARCVGETFSALESIVHSRGLNIVANINHAAAAANAGLDMRPTQLLIFGNPSFGTPLMSAVPSTAIDLPLKVLVWEDMNGCVWLTYNSPHYLQQRHTFPEELIKNIDGVGSMCEEVLRGGDG